MHTEAFLKINWSFVEFQISQKYLPWNPYLHKTHWYPVEVVFWRLHFEKQCFNANYWITFFLIRRVVFLLLWFNFGPCIVLEENIFASDDEHVDKKKRWGQITFLENNKDSSFSFAYSPNYISLSREKVETLFKVKFFILFNIIWVPWINSWLPWGSVIKSNQIKDICPPFFLGLQLLVQWKGNLWWNRNRRCFK